MSVARFFRSMAIAKPFNNAAASGVYAPLLSRSCAMCARPPAGKPLSPPSSSSAPVVPPLSSTQLRRSFLSPPGNKSALISTQPSPDGEGTIPVVLVPDAKQIWNEFDAIVDVREKAEVDEGMIPGATHIPLGTILADPNIASLKGKKQVLVYCRAGIRSAKACAAMQKAGLSVVNLGGGYLAWLGDKK